MPAVSRRTISFPSKIKTVNGKKVVRLLPSSTRRLDNRIMTTNEKIKHIQRLKRLETERADNILIDSRSSYSKWRAIERDANLQNYDQRIGRLERKGRKLGRIRTRALKRQYNIK